MISIVIPVFNSMETLDETFGSALKSGVAGQEIILVDDGSTDGSWEALCRYREAHANVVALRHDRNRGGGAARNTGVATARHPVVLVLDSDDVLVENALPKALALLTDRALDGVATGRSVFFRTSTANPVKTIAYSPGPVGFRDLVSQRPNPVVGNLLFTKSAFLTSGGYPEHHGLDTQAFGFRLLGNNARIHTLAETLYFQRLPIRPSYYIREYRAGNLGRGWHYIFMEYLYKFKEATRYRILDFPYSDPRLLAKGSTISSLISTLANQQDIFSTDGLALDDKAAYAAYDRSSDPTLQAWCAVYDLRRNELGAFLERFSRLGTFPYARRLLYPLLATWSRADLDAAALSEIRYFFAREKGRAWWIRHTLQRVLNRWNRLVS